LIRDRSPFRSLTLLAPAGIRVKGIPCGDNFIWGPEEAVRNLYHDQTFADRILALTPTEPQMDVMLKNRFTVAKLGWQPRWFNPDLEKWLHRIKLPAFVLWGDDDKIMPPAYAALWRERLPILGRHDPLPLLGPSRRLWGQRPLRQYTPQASWAGAARRILSPTRLTVIAARKHGARLHRPSGQGEGEDQAE
jgi:pimeloyl-ACP methyl ester carboxylesterase